MKKTAIRKMVRVAIVSIFIFSCKKSADLVSPDAAKMQDLNGEIATQLKSSEENLTAQKIDASIISYKVESELKNDDEVESLKQQLLSTGNVVPQFDGFNAATFSVNTIRERMASYAKDPAGQQNVVENLREIVLPSIKKGQKVLDILWQVKGKQFHSKCVYDDNGVVYDNMLSNIAFTETAATPADDLKLSSKLASDATAGTSERTQYSFTSTVRNITIKWLWGSTRGKVIIKHYIIWNGVNYIYDHGGSTDAWMSVGSAKARWANNYLNRRSRSKMAWGYGWATPTASFSIKFNSTNITFSASTSGVGSKGAGDGIHTIYL